MAVGVISTGIVSLANQKLVGIRFVTYPLHHRTYDDSTTPPMPD
jgi:hypothetical protein